MKVQELLENAQNVILQTDSYDEYQAAIDKLTSQNDRHHYEEISPEGSEELFDVIVEMYSYSEMGQTRDSPAEQDIDWGVEFYGTGDFDNDRSFYIIQTDRANQFNLPQQVSDSIESDLVEKASGNYSQDSRDEYEADMRGEEERWG